MTSKSRSMGFVKNVDGGDYASGHAPKARVVKGVTHHVDYPYRKEIKTRNTEPRIIVGQLYICKGCKKEFIVTEGNIGYCSLRCNIEANRMFT